MRQWIVYIFLFVSSFTKAQSDSTHVSTDTSGVVVLHWCDSLLMNLISEAGTYIGTPYKYAGASHSGIDCSGFVCAVYKSIGITLPRSSVGMVGSGREVEPDDIRPGDILFFSGTNRRRSGIGHVGVVTKVAEGEITFIHAATHGGVREDVLSTPYYAAHFHHAERLKVLDDFIYYE